jgi:hypothetical protein
MNGFAEHGLDEGAFGEKGSNIVQAFDYFRKCFLYFRSSSECVLDNLGVNSFYINSCMS